MNKLKQCAINFESLLDIEYKIVLGRKGKETCFTIDFLEEEFFHLVGLQYLKDLTYLKKSREYIFDRIMNDDITYDMISKSYFFTKPINDKILTSVSDRIDAFCNIVSILDSKNIYFKYSQNRNAASKIQAEFLLKTEYDNQITYIFLQQRVDSKARLCKSFFPKDKLDYSKGQAQMTLLYKEKLNKASGEYIEQVNHDSIKNKKFIAIRGKDKKKVKLELRYFNKSFSAKKEERAKEALAKYLAKLYSDYLQDVKMEDDLYNLIQRYKDALSIDYKEVINNIIII